MDEWVNGWPHVKSLKSNKSRPIRDNSIMDIFLDILLKPPQPLMGLFFHVMCHVELTLRQKIENGEFVELKKLLPRNRGAHSYTSTEDNVMELVSKGGHTFFVPARDRDNKINNIKKWD